VPDGEEIEEIEWLSREALTTASLNSFTRVVLMGVGLL